MPVPKRNRRAAGRAAIPRMNRERVSQRAVETSKSSGGSSTYNIGLDYFKPVKGTQLIRILPYIVTDPNHPDRVPVGELWYRRPLKVHFGVGPEEKARVCPSTLGKPCPICRYALERRRSGEASDEELSAWKAKDRDLFLVADPNDPTEIKSWEISFHLFTKMLNREINEDPNELAGFADFMDGLDLKARFSEASMGAHKFLEVDRIDFVERKKDTDPELFKSLPALDDCLIVLDYKTLEAEFLGIPSEDVNDEPEYDEPEEDEPEEDEPEEDEPEEDEPEYDDEPEEDEEDDDEVPFEEAEPPPKITKAPKKTAPAPLKRRKAAATKSAPANACPDGGVWGEDCNALEACDLCDTWEACQEEFNRITLEKRKARK